MTCRNQSRICERGQTGQRCAYCQGACMYLSILLPTQNACHSSTRRMLRERTKHKIRKKKYLFFPIKLVWILSQAKRIPQFTQIEKHWERCRRSRPPTKKHDHVTCTFCLLSKFVLNTAASSVNYRPNPFVFSVQQQRQQQQQKGPSCSQR